MAYPYYTGQQPGVQPMPVGMVYGYPQQAPQGQLEQLRAAQAYQPQPQPMAVPQATQNASTGIPWVQGEAGAKAYLVTPGGSVLLMDSEAQSFYIKSADGSGMPLPLRIFDYTERQAQTPKTVPPTAQDVPQQPPAPPVDYVTKDELDALRRRLDELERARTASRQEEQVTDKEKGGTNHGKRGISAAQP